MTSHFGHEQRWYRHFGKWWELHIGHRGIDVEFTIPLPPRIRFRRTPAEDAERLDEGLFPIDREDGWM